MTKQKENAVYQTLEEFLVGENIHSGVLKDLRIEIFKDKHNITLCQVAFFHAEQDRVYEFISIILN